MIRSAEKQAESLFSEMRRALIESDIDTSNPEKLESDVTLAVIIWMQLAKQDIGK